MNILHLSDIHFGRNYERYRLKDKFDNKNQILAELIEHIKNLEMIRPGHIVVTGDIAWYGKRDEYEEALVWFKQLLKETGLTGKDITFCVGNHDVNRSYANMHRNINDDSTDEIDDIYDYNHVHEMEPPIYEYDRFCEELGVEPFAYPRGGKLEYSYSIGYKDVKFSLLNTIRLVAFNTALLSFFSNTSISEDKMWIGQKQVKALLQYGIIPSTDVHYTIALFHHAERFLHPNEICEYDGRVATLNLLRKNVDLILCGHTETGGKPVLQQQLGGGKILTAGATYFSDTHPNTFSILCIPDNERDVLINPYTYKNGWKHYELEPKLKTEGKLYDMPALGEIIEACKFVLKAGEQKYEIPLKRVSVYTYTVDGKPYVKIDNRKEVLRHLDVQCDAPMSGGKTDFIVLLAPKMERSVRAILERDEYFSFLHKNVMQEHVTEIYIESASGTKIVSGSGVAGTIDVDEESLNYLRKIEKIEYYYDRKFYRPDDLYERDADHIELLNELIEEGYTEKLKLGQNVSTNFSQQIKLKQFCEQATKLNSFCLFYEAEFFCNLFGVKFSIGPVLIVSGKYHVDLKDIQYKLDTFMDGDSRQVVFAADDEFENYFIIDKEKAKDKILMDPEYKVFIVEKLGLKWDFIYEE